MTLYSYLSQNKLLWDSLYVPDIESFYEYQTTPWAQGGHSDVFLLSDHRTLCKRETLYTTPSPHNNASFYQKGGDGLWYLKESFLLEALVMETLHPVCPDLLPKVFQYKFGQTKDGTWISVLVMENIEGQPYPPTPFHKKTKKSLWIPFMQHMKHLYHTYCFIHGDLIFRNIKIKNNRLVLIDFGLSSLRIHGMFFCRYHSFRRAIEQLLDDPVMIETLRTTMTPATISDCSWWIDFIQRHRQGVDSCALLGRFLHQLPSSFVPLLFSCIGGRTGKPQQTTMTFQPFPMSYSRRVLTYDDIIPLLETM